MNTRLLTLYVDGYKQRTDFGLKQNIFYYDVYTMQLRGNEQHIEQKTQRVLNIPWQKFRNNIPLRIQDFNLMNKILIENIDNSVFSFDILYTPQMIHFFEGNYYTENNIEKLDIDVKINNLLFITRNYQFKIKNFLQKYAIRNNLRHLFVLLNFTIVLTQSQKFSQLQYEKILKQLDSDGYNIYKNRFNQTFPEFSSPEIQNVIQEFNTLQNYQIPNKIRWVLLSLFYDFIKLVRRTNENIDQQTIQKYLEVIENTKNYYKSIEVLNYFVDFRIYSTLYSIQSKLIENYKQTQLQNENQSSLDIFNQYNNILNQTQEIVEDKVGEFAEKQFFGIQDFLIDTNIQNIFSLISIYNVYRYIQRNHINDFIQQILQFQHSQLSRFLVEVIKLYKTIIQYIIKKIVRSEQQTISIYNTLRYGLQIIKTFFEKIQKIRNNNFGTLIIEYANDPSQIDTILNELMSDQDLQYFVTQYYDHIRQINDFINLEQEYIINDLEQLNDIVPILKIPQLWIYDFNQMLNLPIQINLTIPLFIPENWIMKSIEDENLIVGIKIPNKVLIDAIQKILIEVENTKIDYTNPNTPLFSQIEFPNLDDYIILIKQRQINNQLYTSKIDQNFTKEGLTFYINEIQQLEVFTLEQNKEINNKIQDDLNVYYIITT